CDQRPAAEAARAAARDAAAAARDSRPAAGGGGPPAGAETRPVTLLEIVATTGGGVLLLVTFYDLFQTVVLPRPAVRKFQLARTVVRPMWRVWRWVDLRSTRVDRSESRMAAFAPIALIVLFKGGGGGGAGRARGRAGLSRPAARDRGRSDHGRQAPGNVRRVAVVGRDGPGEPPRIPASDLLPVEPRQRGLDQLLRRGHGCGGARPQLGRGRSVRRQREADVHDRQPPGRGRQLAAVPQSGRRRGDHRARGIRGRDRAPEGGRLPRPGRRCAL